MHVGVGWGLFAVVALLIVLFSGGFVWIFKDKSDPGKVTMVVGFFSLLVTLLSLFLIPVDVYITSGMHTPGYSASTEDVKHLYYAFYVALMVCFWVGLPFGYFYYEELGDLEDSQNTFCRRALEAMKYTSCFVIIFTILIVTGLFIDLGKSPQPANSWTHKVTDRFKNRTDRILPFIIAVMTVAGLAFSMLYTAWGLAGFPISLVRAAPVGGTEDVSDIDLQLRKTEKEIEYLDSKNRGTPRTSWQRRDDVKMKTLERKKSSLIAKRRSTQASIGSSDNHMNTCCYKFYACVWNSFAPVRYLLAVLAMGFSCVIISSMMIHLIDQSIHSTCKAKCGFAMDQRHIINPMGFILENTAQFFPIDYILFSGVIFWLFWCTIWAVSHIGVRFLCYKCFNLRPGRTTHNGLLMALAFLILIIVSFNYQMLSLAPTYTTYGHKTNCNASTCGATQIFYFLSAILIGMPVFGMVYYIFSWIYVLIFIVSLVYNVAVDSSASPKGYGTLRNSDDELEAVFQ